MKLIPQKLEGRCYRISTPATQY